MTFTARLADWAAGDALPICAEAKRRAGDALIDIIACMIGGGRDPSTQRVMRAVASFGSGRALAFGTAERFPAPWAALVSGTAAHALDFDDGFEPGANHPTAASAPALLALADEEELSGPKVVEAYIVALELQGRIGTLLNPDHYRKGWHATSTIGTVGAAGGCARLLNLPAKGVLAAMAIAASMAGGTKMQFGTPMKPVHAGLAAKNAVLAARMAQAGLGGNSEPLLGTFGLLAVMGDGNGQERQKPALEGLGKDLIIMTHGVMAKRFPCCAATHRTLDGIEGLRGTSLKLDEIMSFDTMLPSLLRQNLPFDRPNNEMEARFSMTYTAARMLKNGRLCLADFTSEAVRDPSLSPWLERVNVISDPDDRRMGEAEILSRLVFRDGSIREAHVRHVKGSAPNPFTQAELAGKFADCCGWAGAVFEPNYDAATKLAEAKSVSQIAVALERAARI